MPNKLLAPAPDELEISVFGPGYGESILIHAGRGVWLAIDSCIDPVTKRSAPLMYLEKLGVDPKTSVDLVVATHWHADHVRGIYELFTAASSARFSCASALTGAEFQSLAKIYSASNSQIPLGPEELYRCTKAVVERGKLHGEPFGRWASPDRLLWNFNLGTDEVPIVAKLTSLSPSDEMLSRSIQFMINEVVALKKGSTAPITPSSPNDVAVALLLEVNGRQILLGSDLEEDGNSLMGWSAVMSGISAQGSMSCAFKVAHHGSASGHHDPVWNTILEDNPLALLTPFRYGKHRIPSTADRQRILNRTNRAFISSDPNRDVKPSKKVTKVQGLLNSTIKNRRIAAGPVGHVRWRAPIGNLSDKGTIELFDGAINLADVQG